MRLLFVSNLFPPGISGGFEIECRQVADALAAREYEVCILTTQYGCPTPMEEVTYPVMRTLKLFYPFDQPITSTIRLKKWKIGKHNYKATLEAIEAFHPDILFIWSPLRIGISPARAAIAMGTTYCWRIGDETLSAFVSSPFKMSFRGIYRWVSDRLLFPEITVTGLSFDKALLISETTKSRIMAQGINLENALIAYKGIPIELFPTKEQPGKLSDPPRLLYVGRLHPQKGVHTILKAMQINKNISMQHLELTIVGTGAKDYTDQLKQMAKDSKLAVKFEGFVPYNKLGSIYRGHDIFIFSSNSLEAQGTTYLEAMSSGLSVIGTVGGGQGEILKNEINALTFPEGDSYALSSLIIRLIEDEPLRVKIALAGAKEVAQLYSFTSYIDKIENFLYQMRFHF